MTKVLALDVGGTNVRLSVATVAPRSVELTPQHRMATRDHASLEDAIAAARGVWGGAGIERIAIGVAGPVSAGICRMTNLGWTVDATTISARFGLPVRVVNDFEAIALGVRYVPPSHLVTLQAGATVASAPIAILGAGTGLGEALLVPGDHGDRVIPTEGGHADLAPASDDDAAFIAYLRRELGGGHVSVERAVSGPGLVSILAWQEEAGLAIPGTSLRDAMRAGDPSAAISEAALHGTDAAAVMALDRFVRLYGAEAGNLALKSVPRGGLFIAGGIAAKVMPKIHDGFLPAFLDKGRMRPLLETIPVHVILDGDVGLRGAAVAR
jgi:glucokinase